jgi:hypothetical protein
MTTEKTLKKEAAEGIAYSLLIMASPRRSGLHQHILFTPVNKSCL